MSTLQARVTWAGGDQLSRIRKNKLRSLRMALKNDYNSRLIQTDKRGAWYGLITTNNTKSDYNIRTLSVEWDSGLEPGDTFKVIDDDTHWMCTVQNTDETAYFNTEIIQCRYTVDVDGTEYWVYRQGPTETDLRWYLKQQVNVNQMNYTNTVFIKKDDVTDAYFHRFTHFKMGGHMWEVAVCDKVTRQGIIELEVNEYFDNTVSELPVVVKEESYVDGIIGETLVKQDSIVGYTIPAECYSEDAEWSVSDNARVELIAVVDDGRMCKVKVHPGAVRYYTVKYGDLELECSVDWHEPFINGPEIVYPYETHTYFIEDAVGEFKLDSKLARIVAHNEDSCTVEIVTGKKGEFTLECTYVADGAEESDTTERVIKIKSLQGGVS